MRLHSRHLATVLLPALLVACGGGDAPTTPTPPPTPTASIALAAGSGSVVAGASTSVDVTVTRGGGFTGAVTVTATGVPTGVTIASQTIASGAASATMTIATTASAAAASTPITFTATGAGVTIASQSYTLTITAPAPALTQLGSDIQSSDGAFGSRMALSANGTRLVVAASGTTNGTTRVYERTGTTWTQLGADIVGEAAGDQAGTSVDINAAGTRIAIGAYQNTGSGGVRSGHVRVYELVGSTWTQVGADLDGAGAAWGIGWSVALSAAGDRVVAGGPGVGTTTGRVMVWQLSGSTWSQLGATLTAGNEFGEAVDISSDGSTIAASEASPSGSSRAGTAHVYRLVGGTWTQLGGTLQGVQISDGFGVGLSLSATGTRIAVAAPGDTLGGRSGGGAAGGVVRVFDFSGSAWTQVGANILGAVGTNGEQLGEALVLSDAGTRLAASGASQNVTRVFSLVSGAWVQTGPNLTTTSGSVRSEGLALSADGTTVAAGYVNGTPRRARVFGITP